MRVAHGVQPVAHGVHAYLVQVYLLLLTEVPIAVFELFQNHFLPRSIEKGEPVVARVSPWTVSNKWKHGKAGSCVILCAGYGSLLVRGLLHGICSGTLIVFD